MTCYHDLIFQPGMLTAEREDGTTIRLSRQEHALLSHFIHHSHTLITRAELIEALWGATGTLSERNIDYLVNRLRKKLGDTVRDSRFIATRYGSGYVWVADPVRSEPLSAFLLIGPVYGSSEDQDVIGDFPHQLASAISVETGGQKVITPCHDWIPDPNGHDDLDFSLDISAHIENDHVHLALVLREGRSRRIIESFRQTWPQKDGYDRIDILSHEIACAMWRYELLIEPGAESAVMSPNGGPKWRDAVANLHKQCGADPTGPEISVMFALNDYKRLIRSVHNPPLSDETWHDLETEIEDLALRALPDAHNTPHLLLAVAKLLRFVDRGYLKLVERLTDEAFNCSTAFAELFAMKGQIKASSGEIDAATILYDKAISMIEPNSKFHIHLLILKIFALMAGENRIAAYNAVVNLHNITPVNRVPFGLLFAPPKVKQLCPDAENMLAAMTHEAGQHLTRYMFRAWARQFQQHEHRQNIMKGFVHHLQRHHGNLSIAPEIAKRFPSLIVSTADPPNNKHDVKELNSFVHQLHAGSHR